MCTGKSYCVLHSFIWNMARMQGRPGRWPDLKTGLDSRGPWIMLSHRWYQQILSLWAWGRCYYSHRDPYKYSGYVKGHHCRFKMDHESKVICILEAQVTTHVHLSMNKSMVRIPDYAHPKWAYDHWASVAMVTFFSSLWEMLVVIECPSQVDLWEYSVGHFCHAVPLVF